MTTTTQKPASTLYRYRCTCGHNGRGYTDGNLATMYGEMHVSDPRLAGGHSWRLQQREADGTWRAER